MDVSYISAPLARSPARFPPPRVGVGASWSVLQTLEHVQPPHLLTDPRTSAAHYLRAYFLRFCPSVGNTFRNNPEKLGICRVCVYYPNISQNMNATKILFCVVGLFACLPRPWIIAAKGDFNLDGSGVLCVLICVAYTVAVVLFHEENSSALVLTVPAFAAAQLATNPRHHSF